MIVFDQDDSLLGRVVSLAEFNGSKMGCVADSHWECLSL